MGARPDAAAGVWLSIVLIVRNPSEAPEAVLAALAAV